MTLTTMVLWITVCSVTSGGITARYQYQARGHYYGELKARITRTLPSTGNRFEMLDSWYETGGILNEVNSYQW